MYINGKFAYFLLYKNNRFLNKMYVHKKQLYFLYKQCLVMGYMCVASTLFNLETLTLPNLTNLFAPSISPRHNSLISIDLQPIPVKRYIGYKQYGPIFAYPLSPHVCLSSLLFFLSLFLDFIIKNVYLMTVRCNVHMNIYFIIRITYNS